MNYADEIRSQAEAAPRAALPAVTAALWRAYGEGRITEAEAETLSGLIEARRVAARGVNAGQGPNPAGTHPNRGGIGDQARVGSFRRGVGSRPRTDASMERRRRWAASGRLPPGLAARFTLAEQAVLALVAAEVARRGDCRLAIDNMAAVAGASRSTVKNAIREAVRLGLMTVEERQITGWRNDTNVIRVVNREWIAWLRLARKGTPLSSWKSQADPHSPQGGGVKSVTTTPTETLTLSESGKTARSKSCRGAAGDLDRPASTRIQADGDRRRAMQ